MIASTYRGWLNTSLLACVALASIAAPAWAQRKKADKDKDDSPPAIEMLTYENPRVIEAIIGLKISTRNGQLGEVIGTTAFPSEWPEQKVEIVQSNVAPGIRQTFRELPGGSRQLLMIAPGVPANTETDVTLKVRITKSHIIGPKDPSTLIIPKPNKLPKDIKLFTGNSPYIDAGSSQVKRIARELADKKPENAWEHVRLIYDWVRENINYERGKIKDMQQILKDKSGDCEDMTGLFVAICRASTIPARVVWIPGHSYPEFYLEDPDGHGFWFPCQVAGSESFGTMADHLPILQKGDRFKVPEKKETQRYLVDFFTSKKIVGDQKPRIEFVRQLLGDAANLKVADELVIPKTPEMQEADAKDGAAKEEEVDKPEADKEEESQ